MLICLYILQNSWQFSGKSDAVTDVLWICFDCSDFDCIYWKSQTCSWHQCPVIDGTMSRLLKICKVLQHDCTLWRLNLGKEGQVFSSRLTPMTCALLSSLACLRLTVQNTRLKSSKWFQPHEASQGLWGRLSSCLCLHIGCTHVNHIRYLFWDCTQEGCTVCDSLNWLNPTLLLSVRKKKQNLKLYSFPNSNCSN